MIGKCRDAASFLSSRAVSLSRELDPLFRSEVREAPIRNRGREVREIGYRAGLGIVAAYPRAADTLLGADSVRGREGLAILGFANGAKGRV